MAVLYTGFQGKHTLTYNKIKLALKGNLILMSNLQFPLFTVLHCGLLNPDRIKTEKLDSQIRTRRKGSTNHEPISNICLEEQNLSRIPKSLR